MPAMQDRPVSQIARIQAFLILMTTGFVTGWMVHFWPSSPLLAYGGAGTMLGGYALVLGIEFLVAARINRADPVLQPCSGELWRAWWREIWVAPQVFAWRQPFHWRSLPDTNEQDETTNLPWLVFVHGFVCNRGFWLPWMWAMRSHGVPYTSVNLEPVFGSIDEYVVWIEEAVQRAEQHGSRPVVLVCHSMGGLAARAWAVQQTDLSSRVAHIVTLGAPHHGTWLGRFSHVPNGIQMRSNSEWLQELEAREVECRPHGTYQDFTCWYSNTDNIVMPASSACLTGADNRLLSGQPHVALAFAPQVLAHTLALLQKQTALSAERV